MWQVGPQKLSRQIREWFFPITSEVEVIYPDTEGIEEEILIATSWVTAYAARRFSARRRIYFMQDDESSFDAVGSYHYLAAHTYNMDYEFFTAGRWLLDVLRSQHKKTGDYFLLCPDRAVYYPRTKISLPELQGHSQSDNVFRICFYNRVATPRRCTEIIWVALMLLKGEHPSIEIFSFGDPMGCPLPNLATNLGILTPDELSQLYSLCDVTISLSGTNLSLLAREVQASGGVVLDLMGDNTRQELTHMEDAWLCEPNVESVFAALERFSKSSSTR